MPAEQPLIITVTTDQASHDYFTKLRDEHFPAWCNYLEAHITLFHRLPATVSLIDEVLERSARRDPFPLGITGIKNMGHGVAFTIHSEEITALHASMKRAFTAYLTGKDRKKLWPHITIQNKVTAWKAQQLVEKLAADFTPFSITATGFSLWKYNKGPWVHMKDFLFEK